MSSTVTFPVSARPLCLGCSAVSLIFVSYPYLVSYKRRPKLNSSPKRTSPRVALPSGSLYRSFDGRLNRLKSPLIRCPRFLLALQHGQRPPSQHGHCCQYLLLPYYSFPYPRHYRKHAHQLNAKRHLLLPTRCVASHSYLGRKFETSQLCRAKSRSSRFLPGRTMELLRGLQ